MRNSHGFRTSASQRAAIRAGLADGLSQTEIAERVGVSRSTVHRVVNYTRPRATAATIAPIEQVEEIAAMIAVLDARVRALLPAGTPEAVVTTTANLLIAEQVA